MCPTVYTFTSTSTMLKLPAGGCWRGSVWQSVASTTSAQKVHEEKERTSTESSHWKKTRKKKKENNTWTINANSCKQLDSWRFGHEFFFIDIFCTNGCFKTRTDPLRRFVSSAEIQWREVCVCGRSRQTSALRTRPKEDPLQSSSNPVFFYLLFFFGISHNRRKHVLLINTARSPVRSRWISPGHSSTPFICCFYMSHSLRRKRVLRQ